MAVKVKIISVILLVCLAGYVYPRHIDEDTDQDPDDLMPEDSEDPWLYHKPDPHKISVPPKIKPPKYPRHSLSRKNWNMQHDEEVEATTESKTDPGAKEVKEPEPGGNWIDKVGAMVPVDWIKWDPSKWDPSKWIPGSHP